MIIPVIIVLGVVLVWIISNYNFFVSSKARIKAAVQEIGNQLKRQSDLIPNLEESTKGYLSHEKGIFKDLTDARKQISSALKTNSLQEMSDAAAKMASVIPSLQVAVEDNPELKGSEVVTKLMDELRDTADKLMYSRRLVIDLTADYNVRRVSVPSNIVASLFKFTELMGLETPDKGDFLKVTEEETKTPKVKL
ncbi:LemA family protein [Patescibacteria group bacterium]|nr:LemA family protein [Patescibacteria group bacterium]